MITDAVEIIDRMFGSEPGWKERVDEERLKLQIARVIYDARTAAGLTQRELAKLVGTSQSAIALLEDADYEGHTLKMLNRIAAALKQRVEVRFVPAHSAA